MVDLTVEENARLKVLYGSADGFHAIDLDSATIYDIYIPQNVNGRGVVIRGKENRSENWGEAFIRGGGNGFFDVRVGFRIDRTSFYNIFVLQRTMNCSLEVVEIEIINQKLNFKKFACVAFVCCIILLNFIQRQGSMVPHCIVILPNSSGMQLLLCYDSECYLLACLLFVVSH